ncbi:PCF11 [Acanthosepion pharaonis]|uniref:PCF11 n=1 Tax=Acanthosepion pharaonis TaxID=158019 RepID=A0A812BP14_ACAPH|nr:PCF11 [Sepia pharaonis]
MADAEEVVEEYRSSLADLTINSKPLISMLTMLAEDHSQYAQHIVQLIEQHLQKVKPSQKLPPIQQKYIVSIFCDTFQKVDERTRGAMYKLRQTWQMYFPNPKLYALDMRVNMMDPAWPIIAEPPEQGNIHVNPRFLVQKEEDEGTLAEQPETLMRKQLIAKQQELLGILQHRMDLEVAEPLPKVDAAVSHKQADNFSKHQDDDVSVISDSTVHSMKASAIRSLPSMVSNKSKDKPNDRNISRMRDRRRGSDDSDKGRRRDDSDSSRDRNRYGRDSRSGSSRRDDDRRSRHRDDDYRDRNTDRFGRERRSKERFNRRKDRYDDDEYDRYQRRRRDRSPVRNRSPESINSRGWQQDNDRKSYKDSKGDTWKSSYDNSDNQSSSDSNQNKMGNLGRSPNSSIKNLHVNHQHGGASPKDHPDDKTSIGKGLKRDRDYRENSKLPSPQRERDASTSPKRMCTDQGMESQLDRHLNTKEDLSDLFGKVDQDYRVPPSNMTDQRIPYMRSGSHSGWAKFKADHPDDFISDEGPGSAMDIDERYKDVDMRWNANNRPGCVGSPMKSFSPRVVDGSARDKQANFIREAAKLAQSGELSVMINEPNRPQFGFNGANMFPPAGAMINDFNRPRGPENFQPRPPHWDLPFVRRPNHPEPIPMIRPSPFPPDRQLENMRFPGHHALPPGVIGAAPVQPLPAPGLVNHAQAPFYPALPPNINAVTLPPMTALPPGLAPVSAEATSNAAAPIVPPQFPQITLTSAGIASVSCPGMPSIPTAPTALATAANVVPSSASLSAPNLAAVAAAAAAAAGQSLLPTSVLNKLVRPAPPMLPLSQPQPPAAPAPPVDVSCLFQKLVDAGIIPTVTADKDKDKPETEKEPEPEVIPELSDFKIEKLKIRYSQFIEELYDGIQCSSCGIRFTVDDTEKYREHLDWHFRQNKREKDDYKVAKYRKWYYEMSEWIQYEEIQDDEEKNRSNFFENMLNPVQEPAFIGPQGNKVIQCPAATGNDTDDVCEICGDPFEQFWEEEEEEWHLKNAVRVEGKTYHPVCYEDVKESVDASSVDTPREITENNPLEDALKTTEVVPATNTTSLASNLTNVSTTTTASSTTTSPSTLATSAPTTTIAKSNGIPVTSEASTAIAAASSTTIASTTNSGTVLSSAIKPALATTLPSSTLSTILAAVTSSEKSNNALTALLADGSSQLSPSSTNADNNLQGNNSTILPVSSSTAEEFNIIAQPITTIVSTSGLKTQGL